MLNLLRSKIFTLPNLKTKRLGYNQGLFGGYSSGQSLFCTLYGGLYLVLNSFLIKTCFLENNFLKSFFKFNLLTVAPPQAP